MTGATIREIGQEELAEVMEVSEVTVKLALEGVEIVGVRHPTIGIGTLICTMGSSHALIS